MRIAAYQFAVSGNIIENFKEIENLDFTFSVLVRKHMGGHFYKFLSLKFAILPFSEETSEEMIIL